VEFTGTVGEGVWLDLGAALDIGEDACVWERGVRRGRGKHEPFCVCSREDL